MNMWRSPFNRRRPVNDRAYTDEDWKCGITFLAARLFARTQPVPPVILTPGRIS
jgi:hypothetical protein